MLDLPQEGSSKPATEELDFSMALLRLCDSFSTLFQVCIVNRNHQCFQLLTLLSVILDSSI